MSRRISRSQLAGEQGLRPFDRCAASALAPEANPTEQQEESSEQRLVCRGVVPGNLVLQQAVKRQCTACARELTKIEDAILRGRAVTAMAAGGLGGGRLRLQQGMDTQ
ncbi:unnamed protein product [Urochloa humidicola]